jgi:[acyl-carrier-protein] S-malonyltransferase
MAAVIGIGRCKAGMLVDMSRGKGILDLANYSAKDQLVIQEKGCRKACELAPQLGAKKCIMLNVSAPFHSGLMSAAVRFKTELEN